MKWIGQHIWDFVSRFRNDVYFENLETTTETNGLVVDANGKLSINPSSGDETAGKVHLYVKAMEDLKAGHTVYASGAVGNSGAIEVNKYIADNTIDERRFVGIIESDIDTGEFGYAITIGTLKGIDTRGTGITESIGETWNEGDILFVSDTYAGEMTNVQPTAPHQVIPCAFILKKSPNGTIAIRAYDLGYHLGELHDLQITAPTEGEVLRYNDTSDIWENTDSLVIDASGNVGIGTTSPSTKLHIEDSSNVYSTLESTGSNTEVAHKYRSSTLTSGYYWWTGLNNYDKYQIAYGTSFDNAGTALCIDASGNVGIGTTSPTNKLHVVGDARIEGDLTVNGTYTQIDTDVLTTEQWLVTNDGTGPAAIINQLGSQDIFDVQDDGASVFYIEDGGQIGMGTTSPTARLHIESADDAVIRLKSTDNKAYIALSDNDTNGYISSENSRLSLGANAGTNANNLNIDLSSNNVGIGTSSPGYRLEVNSSTIDTVAKFESTDTLGRIELKDSNDSAYVGTQNNKAFIGMEATATGTNNLIVTSDGKVGIGTSSPNEKLTIVETSGGTDVYPLQLSNESITDSSGVGIVFNVSSNTAYPNARILVERTDSDATGEMSFWTVSGNSGVISERMRIDKDGNVGIGTTSPGQKLEVDEGYINVTGAGTSHGYMLSRDGLDTYMIRHLDGGLTIQNSTDSRKEMTFDGDGNVGIGTTTPTEKLEVNGNIAVSGTVDGVDIGANYANWNTAYSWGNHASAGYLTSSSTQSKYLRSDETDYFTGKLNWDGADYTDGINMSLGNIRDAHRIDANEFFQGASGRARNNLGDPTVTEMALFEEQFKPQTTLANDYDDLTDLTFWYQETSSSSWVEDTSYSDDQKRKFLRTNNSSVIIPNLYYKFRVEFNAKSYTFANAMYMYWSSQSHNTQVHVWKKRCSDGTWLQHTSSTNTISSWPGHGYLPFSKIAWHETNTTSTSHFTHIRFEFTPNWSGHATYGDRPILLYGMQIWGGYPSGRRTPHYYDQNGEFNFLKDAHILDSNKLNVGTGNDLQIYHDGSNSYIDDAGTGNLKIRSNRLQLEKYTGETMAEFIADGASSLYYDNNKKLETTSTGVEVTGDVVISSDSFLKTSNNNLNFIELYNGSDASMRFRMGHATVGRFQFLNNSDTEVFTIDARNEKVGIGTTSPTEKLHVNGNGLFNGGLTVGDSAADTFITRGHTYLATTGNNVGIGTTSPTMKLDVVGYIRSANTVADSTTKYSGFFGRHYTNSEEDVLAISTESTISHNNIYIGGGFGTRNSATTIRFSTAANNTTTTGTERMRIDPNGNVGIGTTSPSEKLEVDGNIKASGTLIAKQYQAFQCNFINDISTTKYYLPLDTVTAQTVRYQDEACMLAHADGRLASVTLKVENLGGASGNITFGIEVLQSTGTGYSGTWTVVETETMAVSSTHNHDVFHFHFSTAKHFDSTHMFAISIQSDNAALGGDGGNDERWFVTPVIEWDYNTYLGTNGTSTRYDTTP